MTYHAVGQHDMLELEPMSALVATEHLFLSITGSVNVTKSAINEPKDIVHGCTLLHNGFTVSFMVHPWLVDTYQQMREMVVNVRQHVVDDY